MSYYLGIDVGTGESKGVLIDSDCKVLCSAACSHETCNPRPGWFEHDAEKIWWGDFCRLSRELLARSGIKPSSIGCVGFSALGCDCVPVDDRCRPLAPAILYGIDSRSRPQIDKLLSTYGEARVRQMVGHDPCSSDIAPKVMWFYENMPEVAARAAKYLTASSFLCAKLTGRFCIDRYLAEDFLPLYNRDTWEVDEEGCKGFCRSDQMAEVMSATEIAGKVTSRAALETGLAVGTPVLVGTGDSGAEAISTGVAVPGDMMVQMGSSCYFIYLSDRMVEDARLWPGTFIIPGTYGICAGTNTAGALTKWIRDEFYRDALSGELSGGPSAFEVMALEASRVAPGADGLVCLPYFAGERTPLNDPLARGVLFGLTVGHTRGHVVRAALEGIAFTVAAHVDILEREHGLGINRLMAVGGGTKNPVWLQAVADACGKEVRTANVTMGACFGDALMAALAGGACEDWGELVRRVGEGKVVSPDPAVHKLYRERRKMFDELYQKNAGLMHALGGNACHDGSA